MAKNCVSLHKEYAMTGKISHTKSYYPEKSKKESHQTTPEGQKQHGSQSR